MWANPHRSTFSPRKSVHPTGFTLLELILALSLSTILLLILTTAIHQFLFRADASGSQVETVQLARAILNRMAIDLRATQFTPASSDLPTTSSQAPKASGLSGTSTEIRIDRSAMWYWEAAGTSESSDSRDPSPENSTYTHMVRRPETVRYFLRDGEPLTATQLAQRAYHSQRGQETSTDAIAGLCLERWLTRQARTDPSLTDSYETFSSTEAILGKHVELLAPEVSELAFAYLDDTGELVDRWDTGEKNALPQAVEIRLVLRKEISDPLALSTHQGNAIQGSPMQEKGPSATSTRANSLTFRLMVHLPDVQPLRQPAAPTSKNRSNTTRDSTADGKASTDSNSNTDASP